MAKRCGLPRSSPSSQQASSSPSLPPRNRRDVEPRHRKVDDFRTRPRGFAAAGEIDVEIQPDWDRLDAAAFRVSMKRSVRWLAWFLAVLGGVALGCGLASAVRSL